MFQPPLSGGSLEDRRDTTAPHSSCTRLVSGHRHPKGRVLQNIYDDPDFYAGYSQLPRSVEGLDGAPEWPALRALLPELRGRRVLDLGCGYGWFCRWAQEQGATRVLGIDVSEKMLARARELNLAAGITYERDDLETFAL